jgi:hypothetical protein
MQHDAELNPPLEPTDFVQTLEGLNEGVFGVHDRVMSGGDVSIERHGPDHVLWSGSDEGVCKGAVGEQSSVR